MTDSNYIKAKVSKVTLKKFDGRDPIELTEQLLSIDIYQSINHPLIMADALIYDTIGLKHNYPLIGEEILEIRISETNPAVTGRTNPQPEDIVLTFMISADSIKAISETVRETSYTLRLYSKEMFENARGTVQKAFKGSYHTIASSILKDYLGVREDKKFMDIQNNFEETKDSGVLVIPNLRPLEAIMMCAKRSIPLENENNFMLFYHTFKGFNFISLEKLAKREKVWDFYLLSDFTRSAVEKVPNIDYKTIAGITVGNEFSTLAKMVVGFYDNEYYGIDIHNNTKKNVVTKLPTTVKHSVEKGQVNTPEFVDVIQKKTDRSGQKTRTRYMIMQGGGDDPNHPTHFEEKVGRGIQTAIAMAQSYLTITVPGNTIVNAGNVVDITIPEVHGFNEIKKNYYKSGKYFVTDIKHSFDVIGGSHTMTLNVTRAGFGQEIEKKMKYGNE